MYMPSFVDVEVDTIGDMVMTVDDETAKAMQAVEAGEIALDKSIEDAVADYEAGSDREMSPTDRYHLVEHLKRRIRELPDDEESDDGSDDV